MRLADHESAYARSVAAYESRYRWATWGTVVRWLAACVALTTALWLYGDCGDMRPARADDSAPGDGVAAVADGPRTAPSIGAVPGPRTDAEAVALARAVLAWAPDVAPRAATVHVVAAEVVSGCRAYAGAGLGAECPSVVMALGWRESRYDARALGRAPWLAVGIFQLHGAALDTWTREEARDARRNTRLAVWWLTECDRACAGVEEALTMYARGHCGRSWGARRLLRMARELRAGGAG